MTISKVSPWLSRLGYWLLKQSKKVSDGGST